MEARTEHEGNSAGVNVLKQVLFSTFRSKLFRLPNWENFQRTLHGGVLMICPTCGCDDADKERIQALIEEKKIPFVCPVCGMIKLPVRATLDRVFVWADPVADTLGKLGLIYLPEVAKENYKTVYGTVLSCGPGYYNPKRHNQFVPTSLKVGDRIAYDKDVLYRLTLRDVNGKLHDAVLMGHEDVYGVC